MSDDVIPRKVWEADMRTALRTISSLRDENEHLGEALREIAEAGCTCDGDEVDCLSCVASIAMYGRENNQTDPSGDDV